MSDFLSTQAPAVSQAIGGVITDFGINDIIQSRKSLAELKVAHTAIMAWARSRDLWWIDTTTTTAAALTASERNVLRAFNAAAVVVVVSIHHRSRLLAHAIIAVCATFSSARLFLL